MHLNVQLSTWIIKSKLETETGWNEDQDPCWFELTFFSNIGVLCDTLTYSDFLNYDIPTVRKSAAHNQQCQPQVGWHNTPYSQTKQPNPKTRHTDAWSRNSPHPPHKKPANYSLQVGPRNAPYSQTKQPNPKTHHTNARSRNSPKPLTPHKKPARVFCDPTQLLFPLPRDRGHLRPYPDAFLLCLPHSCLALHVTGSSSSVQPPYWSLGRTSLHNSLSGRKKKTPKNAEALWEIGSLMRLKLWRRWGKKPDGFWGKLLENLIFGYHFWIPSLKLTAKAPENGWLEYDLLSYWVSAYFQGLKPVSFRVYVCQLMVSTLQPIFFHQKSLRIASSSQRRKFMKDLWNHH